MQLGNNVGESKLQTSSWGEMTFIRTFARRSSARFNRVEECLRSPEVMYLDITRGALASAACRSNRVEDAFLIEHMCTTCHQGPLGLAARAIAKRQLEQVLPFHVGCQNPPVYAHEIVKHAAGEGRVHCSLRAGAHDNRRDFLVDARSWPSILTIKAPAFMAAKAAPHPASLRW